MKIFEQNGYKFYCREFPRFDDEFCVNEVVKEDVYKMKDWDFKDGVIVDIGANIGTFSIPASKYGKVYAYEPNIENFQILKMNIALNNANVEAFNYAIGKPGEDTIENSSGHSRIGSAGGSGKQKVKIIGFDDIPVKDIDLLKMDCEGGEYNVVKYASDKRLSRIKNICGEFHSWIFEDVDRKIEHDEMIGKLNKFFDIQYEGYKGSAFFGKQRFNPDLAVGIKTFMREETLLRCLDSIDQFLPNLRIYIVDDSDIGATKQERYEFLENMGHKVIKLPFDSGLSVGRNTLMESIKEPYVLYCDDDYVFSKDNGVWGTLDLIKSRPDIDMITGSLSVADNDTGSDRPLNFFIAKTETFKKNKWNPKYKINDEHKDFFDRFQGVIYHSDKLKASHDTRIPGGEYAKYRNRTFRD